MPILLRYLLVFLLLSTRLLSQDIISSDLHIRTCIDTNECKASNELAWLFYDESKNEFYLKVDLSYYKDTTRITNADWLRDLADSTFYFKGFFPKEKFPAPEPNKSASYKVNGKLFLNGIWNNQTVQISILVSENNFLDLSSKSSAYDQYKINFGFSFLPVDHKIQSKPHHLTKPIFVAVALGRINLLRRGMEPLLGEAYDYR
jgi:hypothetical protein